MHLCVCVNQREWARELWKRRGRERLSISSLGQLLFGSLLLKCSQWAGYTKACSIVLNSCALHTPSLSLLLFFFSRFLNQEQFLRSLKAKACGSNPPTHTLTEICFCLQCPTVGGLSWFSCFSIQINRFILPYTADY